MGNVQNCCELPQNGERTAPQAQPGESAFFRNPAAAEVEADESDALEEVKAHEESPPSRLQSMRQGIRNSIHNRKASILSAFGYQKEDSSGNLW